MKAILLLSQLVIPQLPQGINETNFGPEVIKTVSCVKDAELDSTVEALDEKTGENTVTTKIIVTAKDKSKVAACAKDVKKEFNDLTIEEILPNLGMFIVSYEAPEISVD